MQSEAVAIGKRVKRRLGEDGSGLWIIYVREVRFLPHGWEKAIGDLVEAWKLEQYDHKRGDKPL